MDTRIVFLCMEVIPVITFSQSYYVSDCLCVLNIFLLEPEPSIIQREYNFEFNCPNSEFDAGDLKDCISNARLCPENDIALCDRPFKRIGSTSVTASLLNIGMRMDGTLPYVFNSMNLPNTIYIIFITNTLHILLLILGI